MRKKKSAFSKTLTVFGRIIALLLVTLLGVAVVVGSVLNLFAHGPSETWRDRFVMTFKETSAMKFVPDLFLSQEEIAAISVNGDATGEVHEISSDIEYEEVDTSLINISAETEASGVDAWGLSDDDGDGIIIDHVKGEGFSGYMMVVLDPSRVIMGSVPESFGVRGYSVEEMVKHYDGVAGINAGGFYDPNGQGNGSIPDSMVVFGGKVYYAGSGCRNGFAGFDADHILHVGKFTADEVQQKNIQTGVSFGPVLVTNGEGTDPNLLDESVNPRTAIGQRSDGAVLLLVIDGRQITSLGASYQNLIDVMLSYGAVNACNLDGGSSSLMWFEDKYINNGASFVGIRPVPTTFIVLKEGANANG